MDHKVKHLINLLIIVGLLFAVSISPAAGHEIHATSSGIKSVAGNSPQDDPLDPTYGEYAEFVNHLGGTSPALAVSGHYAYLGMGPRLGIVDVSNPANPVLLGLSNLTWGPIRYISVQGPYAYVISFVEFSPYGDQLTIYDVTDPRSPQAISQIWLIGPVSAIAQKGDFLFLGRSQSLEVYDISNPTDPHWVAGEGTTGYVNDIAIDGDNAYVAVDNFGYDPNPKLDIIDIHNPSAPGNPVPYYLDSNSDAVAASGHFVYLTTYSGFHVIDVSNLQNIHQVGEIPSYMLGDTHDLNIRGSTVYALTGSLYMINVSDPAQPSLSSNVYIFPTYPSQFLLLPGSPSSQLLGYFSDYNAGLYILDLTQPASMSQLSVFANPPGWVDGIKVAGDYAYLSGSGFSTWNLSDPAHPSLIAQTGIPEMLTDIESHYAYLIDQNIKIDPIKIVDIADPANPHQVGAYSSPVNDYIWSVDVEEYPGNQLFAFSSADHNLFVSDVTDPTAVTAAGVYTSTDYINNIAISGPDSHGKFYAYVPDDSYYKVHIVDITDPYHPQEAGQIDHSISPDYRNPTVLTARITASKTILYMVANSYGEYGNLGIVDVSDPANPGWVGSLLYEIKGAPQDIQLKGDYAYLAQEWGNLQIADISDPSTPKLAGYFREPSDTFAVAVKGDFAYLADWRGGLYVSWFGPGVQQDIPTSGGNISSTFDATSDIFPSGTFTDTVTITHTPRYAPNLPSTGRLAATGHSFELRNFAPCCEGALQPTQPFTLTIQYSPEQIISAFESTLALYSWDGTQWVKEPTSSLDMLNHSVTAHPNHFSTFALLQSQLGVYLPLLRH